MRKVKIWLSILGRKRFKRGSFTTFVEHLQAKALAFIEHFNRTRAKPFKWTTKGTTLAASPKSESSGGAIVTETPTIYLVCTRREPKQRATSGCFA